MASNTPCWLNIPTVEKCCCLKLRTGGIIISCLLMIPVVLAVGITTWDLIRLTTVRSRIRTDDAFINTTEEFEKIEGWHDSYIAQFAMAHALALTILAISILHLYGAVKEKRLFMIPFITFLGMVVNTIICSEVMRIVLLTSGWIGFLNSAGVGGLGLYTVVVLLSYYRELKQKPITADAKEDDVIEAIEDALW